MLNQKERLFDTKRLTIAALLTAIGIVLMYIIRIPMFLPFLEYSPADIPIFVGTLAFGPIVGLVMTVAVSVLQGLTVSAGSGWIGIVMNIASTGSFVLVAGLIYRRKKTLMQLGIALGCAVLVSAAVMMLMNLLFMPLFTPGLSVSAVWGMMLPSILPFNLVRAGLNAVGALLVFKAVGQYLESKRL